MKKRFNTLIFQRVRAQVYNVAFVTIACLAEVEAHPGHPIQSASVTPLKETLMAPPESDGVGIIVRLELPWKVLLWGEAISYNYVLENRSSAPIPVAIPYRKYGLGAPNGGQVFLEGHHHPIPPPITSPYYSDTRLLRVEEAAWPPLTLENQPVDLWTELPPGHRIVWNHARLNPIDFPIGVGENLRSIQAHWLVGKGKWVSSPPVDVRVENVDRKNWERVFSQNYDDFGIAGANSEISVYRVPLGGKHFLFTEVLRRICEVGVDDKLAFLIDAANDQMEITLAGATGVRKQYLALGQGLVRDRPWKAQGYAALVPQPEPIPEADADPVTDSSPALPNLLHSGEGEGGADAPVAASWPWWIGGAIALFLVALAIFLIRRKA